MDSLYAVQALDHLVIVGCQAEVLDWLVFWDLVSIIRLLFLFGNWNQVSHDVRVLVKY
jgi:hypothetical protein